MRPLANYCTLGLGLSLTSCVPSSSPASPDSAGIEAAVRHFGEAAAAYDFDRVATYLEPTTLWVERSFAIPWAEEETGLRTLQSAAVKLRFAMSDFHVGQQADAGWAAWKLDAWATAETDSGRAVLRAALGTSDTAQREWHYLAAESTTLRRSAKKWRLVLGHSSFVEFAK